MDTLSSPTIGVVQAAMVILDWYRDQAHRIQYHMERKEDKEAIEIVAALALDGGNKAACVMATLETVVGPVNPQFLLTQATR